MAKLFNKFTNRQGLLVYGGEASSDYGMVVAEAPTFERPARKKSVFTVPGRNGAIVFQQDAWDDVTRSYRVWIAQDKINPELNRLIDDFEAWLNSQKGYQRLEDNFEPEIFRLAYYNGGNSFSNTLTAYGEADISFTCRPERFYKDGEKALTVVNGDKIFNPTRFSSKPLIHIEGSGTITVSCGGKTLSANVTDYINIDCETMNAYRQAAENKNSQISGSFPTVEPGFNTVGLTGSVSKCTITPRYFTI